MRIVLDAMGADAAPDPEVRGAVEASLETQAEIVLVGDEPLLKKKLEAFPKRGKIYKGSYGKSRPHRVKAKKKK